MGLMREIGAGPVALDTSVFIYYMEEDSRFLHLVEPVFRSIDAGRLSAVASSLTLLEVLVVPFRAGDVALASRYESLLVRGRGLSLVDLDRPVLRLAAQIRAAFGAKTPDALQLACASAGGATTFLTNDRDLPEIPGLRILQLQDF
jgi:predicted nucleic acid-binding protein